MIPPFPRTAEFAGERLVAIGGVPVDVLAREYGTPLYVVDRAEFAGRLSAWREAFGPSATVAYAAKALCVVGLLQLVDRAGLHVDVASAGELATAERAGVAMAHVVFHGNNKSAGELAAAVRLGVGRVVVDSFVELQRLSSVAEEAGRDVDVLLRVTPGIEAGGHDYIRTGGDDSKFGFGLSAGLAGEAVARTLKAPRLRLRGVHCHIGSMITTHDPYVEAVRVLTDFLAEVHAEHGTALSELNVGGGVGIVHEPTDEVPEDAGALARALHAAVAEASTARGLPAPRLSVEPGRAIAGPAGITLYTVGTVKEIPGVRTYAAVDGGMSDNIRPALYGARYTFALAGSRAGGGAGVAGPAQAGPGEAGSREAGSREAGSRRRAYTIAGKHCESGDVIGRDVFLPADLGPGDRLAVAATGAYTFAMASNYNRLTRPAMVLVGDGRVSTLVRRETVEDLLARDVPLE